MYGMAWPLGVTSETGGQTAKDGLNLEGSQPSINLNPDAMEASSTENSKNSYEWGDDYIRNS